MVLRDKKENRLLFNYSNIFSTISCIIIIFLAEVIVITNLGVIYLDRVAILALAIVAVTPKYAPAFHTIIAFLLVIFFKKVIFDVMKFVFNLYLIHLI